MSSRPI